MRGEAHGRGVCDRAAAWHTTRPRPPARPPARPLARPLTSCCPLPASFTCRYGVLGGLTPIVITAIQKGMAGSALYTYGPAFWLLALGALSLLSCACMRAYNPRLNQPFIGRIE